MRKLILVFIHIVFVSCSGQDKVVGNWYNLNIDLNSEITYTETYIEENFMYSYDLISGLKSIQEIEILNSEIIFVKRPLENKLKYQINGDSLILRSSDFEIILKRMPENFGTTLDKYIKDLETKKSFEKDFLIRNEIWSRKGLLSD